MATTLAPSLSSPSRPDRLVVDVVEGEPDSGGAVYLGFGLATREALSVGRLPFDALAMMITAAEQRDARSGSAVVHLVADEHALVNAFATRRQVARAGAQVADEVARIAGALDLGRYDVVRASCLCDDVHREMHAYAAARCEEPYAARQAADVEWAHRVHGASVKVGWTMSSGGEGAVGFDERHFDAVHGAIFGHRLTAVYAAPGRCLDPDRPRCSPYTLLPGQRRLDLAATRADIEVCCASRSMRRHLAPLCDAVLDRLGTTSDAALADRVELALGELAVRI